MKTKALFLLLLCACSPSSFEDFQNEGEAKSRQLVAQMHALHTHEDLLQAENSLKKKFHELVDLMIAARNYQEKHLEAPSPAPNSYSDRLLTELKRIFAIDGGREIIERAQREPLIRLDAFERKLKEGKDKVPSH